MYEHVLINDLKIAHQVIGDGDPILMLHGWGATSDLLLPIGKKLATMGYQVYMPDLPGHGETPPPPIAWSVMDYAQLMVAYLSHHHISQTHLFGHSFGGRISLVLGAEYPQLICKIVLSDAAGIRPKTPLHAKIRLSTYKGIRDGLTRVGLPHLSDTLRLWYSKRYGSSDFQGTSGVMRDTFIRVVNEDLSNFASKIQAPTLLIWGKNDQDTPLWQAKKLESLIPDAGLVVYPNAGHYSYLEQPDQTVQAMHALFKAN